MTIESKSLIKADLDSCEKISFGKRLGRPRWSALRIIAETQIEYQGGGLLGSGRVTGIPEHSGNWVEMSGMPTSRPERRCVRTSFL
jgi:hypothetical protein